MKQGQETNHIWTQEAGTHDTQQNPDSYSILFNFLKIHTYIMIRKKIGSWILNFTQY